MYLLDAAVEAKFKYETNVYVMVLLKIFLLFGVVFGPNAVQGQQHCPRTNKEANKFCASECVLSLDTCSSENKECVCDGDCGYSCIKKDLRCRTPKPRELEHGQRVVSGKKFNHTATFTCNEGYMLSGASVRRCRGGGVWDGVEPKCGKNCSDPVINNNTLIRRKSISNSGYMTSDTVYYYCTAGYVIEGKDVATCQPDGTWDIDPPHCYRISCPPPTLPANSKVLSPMSFNTSQGASDGKIVVLTCKPGYYRIGSFRTMTCSAGQWQLPASFKCSPKSCADPGTPRNGGKTGLTYLFKDKVEFYCDECYKLLGDSYRYCNADQSWSGQQPTCERVETRCKKISTILNGYVSKISNECGGKAEFSCDRYHNIVGKSKIVCNDNGTWSAATPYCEPVTCSKLNTSKAMVVKVSGYEYGSRAKFSCEDSNFTLSNNSVISCRENGEWSAEVPKCLAPCHVNATTNLVSQKVYKHGSEADLKCKEGFQLSGTINGKMPVCFNGKWNSLIFPYCVEDHLVEQTKQEFNRKMEELMREFAARG